MDDLMTCAICLDRFTVPKVLPCQHTFCLRPCLEGLVSNGRIKCPECRAVHKVPSQGVSGFPNNLTMIKLMDTPHQVSRPSCEECKAKNVLSGLCIHCNETLCHPCLLKHTITLKFQLQDSVSKISQKSSDVSRKVSQVEQMQKRLKDNEEKLVATIEKWYHSCLSELQIKKSKFLQSVKSFINKESRVLQDKREGLEVELALMNSFCENANKRSPNPVSIGEIQTPLLEMIRESKGLLETSVAEIKTEKFAKFSDDKASNITQTISEFDGVEIQDRPVSLVEKKAAHRGVVSANKQFGFGEDQPTTSGLTQRKRKRNLAIATSAKETKANHADTLIVEDKQPPGQMILKELRFALPGYENDFFWNITLEFTYKFPEGCMNGIKYISTEFKAYLPHSTRVYNVLSNRLCTAFDAGEVFRLQHRLGEKTGQIIWGDIPHKTSKTGGPENNGYPDNGYWDRLLEVLRAKGFV